MTIRHHNRKWAPECHMRLLRVVRRLGCCEASFSILRRCGK